MKDEHKPIVYVSYSRKKEKEKNFLPEIVKNLPDVNIKIDTDTVKYRDNFLNFIDEIGKAPFILVLFSEDYFKSFYCMYELTKVMRHGGKIEDRVFIVRDDDFLLNNESNKKIIRDYWQELNALDEHSTRAEHLTPHGELEQIAEVNEQLEKILTQFSTTNAPDKGAFCLTESDDNLRLLACKPIREWLKELIPPAILSGRASCGDRLFCNNVQGELESILEEFSLLYEYIAKQFDGITCEEDLAKTLCAYEDKRGLISPILIKACKKAVRQEQKENVDNLKSNIRNMISWLSILLIKPDWVENTNKSRGTIPQLPVTTGFGELVTAARLGQVKPEPYLNKEQTNQISGKHELAPFKSGTWDNSNNIAINAIMRFIFNQVFKLNIEKKSIETGSVTEKERTELNTQIQLDAENGSRYYYCMLRPQETDSHFMDDPKLIHQLREFLPALDIFRVQDSIGNVAFIVSDEVTLSQTYHYFLTQLESW